MTEEVTAKTTRRPKAAPKAAAVAEPTPEETPEAPTTYARVGYNHKPSDGDLQAILPRLLEALAPQVKGEGKTLADVRLTVTTSKEEDGNWHVLVTA